MFRTILSKSILTDPQAALESKKIVEAARAMKINDSAPAFLSDTQREARRIRMFAKSVDQLSEYECATLLSREPELPTMAFKIVSQLVSLDKPNASNPTRIELLDSVAQSVREDRPLEMFASLCLEKGPGLRDGKLDWYLKSKQTKTPETLATSASIKGWSQVKKILDTINYPVQMTFLLGDQDYSIVDGCRYWCQSGWEDQLSQDTDRILKETQARADAFFGAERGVRVAKWSSLYSADKVEMQLPRAETLVTIEKSPAIVKGSFEMYKRQWGYSALSRKLKIDEDTLDSFITGDVQRMAAQYRVEANYVRCLNGIQLWCEAVPNPGWPIQLSNFDRSGYAPSLIMD
jgi:ribosomal protein S10